MTQEELLARLKDFNKSAFQPMPPQQDPAMAQQGMPPGAPPMDPAMAQQGMPPPGMEQGMPPGAPPMDPSMQGAPPPGGDPMEQVAMALEQMAGLMQQQDQRIAQLEEALMAPQGMDQGMDPSMGGMPPGMDPAMMQQGMPPGIM
jgi:hypothetical protein